jgi:dTDP-4-amino-4,6-dideoxygalactose transaminase
MISTRPVQEGSKAADNQSDKPPIVSVGTLQVSQRGRQLVMQTLLANRLSYGPMQQEFESRFAALHGCQFGVLSNSGTSALHLAVQALKTLHGWKDGDEIIVPSVTFVATINVLLHNRLQPVLVDVERDYYGLDPAGVAAAITPRTRAVLPVHLFGLPCDMDGLAEAAPGLPMVEDSCETMFASYKGRKVGSMGAIGCFSTYVAHLLVTGVGGLNITNNPDYAVALRSLMNHGRDSIYISIDDDDDAQGEMLKTIIARRFSFIQIGHSFRVTEMEAALGLAQLEEWEPMIAARRTNAAYLIRSLSQFQDRMQLPAVRAGCDHSFMMFPIVLRDQAKTDLVHFLEEHHVETRDMLPITSQPVYRGMWDEKLYPNADWINKNGFYIGCHQGLSQHELDYVVELFERFWRVRRTTAPVEPSVLLLVTRDSAAWLPEVLDTVPVELFSAMVAVDLGSQDRTLDILQERRLTTISAEGRNLLQVLQDAAIPASDNVVFFPADGRHQVRDIGRLLLMMERGYDMVFASRFVVGGERLPGQRPGRYRSVGNRVFTLLADLLFGGNLSDSLMEFRAVKRSRLLSLHLKESGLPFLYRLSIQGVKKGWRLAEIPTTEVVDPSRISYGRIAASLGPLLLALLREMGEK